MAGSPAGRAHGLVLLGGVAGSAAAVLLLHRAGASALRTPPIHSWDAVTRWYDALPPEVAALALLRLLGLALAGWLLVATSLQVLAAVPHLAPVGWVADCVSPRSLQRLGHGLAGLSLSAGLSAGVPSAGTPEGARPVASAVAHGDDDHADTATMRLLDDAPAGDIDQAAADVVVEVGDSLWSIAVDRLAEGRGVPPSDREVVAYWRRLIDQNRSRLVDPDNPDLIYPGQTLTLPAS
jgi:hypothetical protein